MNFWSIFDLSSMEDEVALLENRSSDIDLWNDPQNAQQVMKQYADLKSELEELKKFELRIQDTYDLAQMADESMWTDIELEVNQIISKIDQLELKALLSAPYDKGNALLTIHAGAGGVDSQDWASMLQRQYLRWAEKHHYTTEILEFTPGEEAGIKSMTISVTGPYAYGYLQSEKGVHRLVRLSPFDSAHRRHTSFAMVEVLPEIEDTDPNIQIPVEDIKIEVYKSSGAGGQNVQKNSTAVRITHLPTGIIASCQNERSQTQNRESALKVLRARLYALSLEAHVQQISDLRGEYTKAEWGSQIRSYVLHPYQMVKDHRTNFEMGNTQAVLDGDLDGLIEAYLKYQASNN
jgi:peptide chain release factor 2